MMASGTKFKDSGVTNYRTDTRQLIQQLMMQESRLTDFQQRHINNQLKNGGALPLTFAPHEEKKVQSEPRVALLRSHQQRRSAERCGAGDNYKREKFQPSATRDLEKEKRRLQNILSMGQKDAGPTRFQRDSTDKREQQPIDRFQEVLDEIEDRRQFLEAMVSLGKGLQYRHIINTEISQKICELEEIDRKRSQELRTLTLNEKEEPQSKDRDGEREGDHLDKNEY